MEMKEFAQALIAELRSANGQQNKAVSGTPNAQLLFGPTGLFSQFGIDQLVVNAVLTPRGLDSVIPVVPTVELYPITTYITGVNDDGSAEPTGPCDDAPSGVMYVGNQALPFGRFTRSSKEMEVNQLMQVLNGHLTTDLRMLGSMVGAQNLAPAGGDPQAALRSVVSMQMMLVGIELQRLMSTRLWSGSPTNNTGSNGYMEFVGLDSLIATGKVDVLTNTALGALDSDVKDFAYESVDSTAKDIVKYLSMMAFYLEHNAERTGLDPVDWVIAMRKELFYELTAIWPTRYLAFGSPAITSQPNVFVMGDRNVDFRDQMRQGKYLTINGRDYPVITDDGIVEQNSTTSRYLNPGEFASDVYFVPLRAKGMPVTYWEHLDYTRAMADVSVLGPGAQKGQFWQTDGGRYMWTLQNLNYCFKVQAKIEPRIVMKTPHLAGRLQNVKYTPLQHLRSADPDSPYNVNSGSASFSTPATQYPAAWF